MNTYLGLDFGTQSVRCGVYDVTGELIGFGECEYETFHPESGWAEQSPADWESAAKIAIAACKRSAGEAFSSVVGMAVDTTSSTVVMCQRERPAENAILWMDNRAKAQARRINELGSKEVLKHCGGAVSVEWLLPKMLWLKENRPEAYCKAEKVCEMQDYINHFLTGIWCASVSQATCKACYVEELGGFQRGFFESIGLEDYFEKGVTLVKEQGEPIGNLREELARELELDPGVTVYQGGIDAHTSMIGLGVTQPGDMGLVMGTSFVHLAVVDRPSFSDEIWGPYKSAIVPGLYCLEGGQISAGSITKWFLREFGIDQENPYGVMQHEAAAVPPGSKGMIALDFFQGNRTPYKDSQARGVFYGLTLSRTRGEIYRSILEGVAFGTRNIVDSMERCGVTINTIMGCGGVTKNAEWLQIISDVTGKPIVLTEQSSNAGIFGCAIIAAVGEGAFENFAQAAHSMVRVTQRIEPDPKNREVYEEAFEKYIALYRSLRPIMQGSLQEETQD